jgi:23S rRNA (guanine2445-N2)-methyltransferase / 23S rRNA (guanine2069-N7)-methyltransferase
MPQHSYFATCPAGLASLLATELAALGATRLRTRPAGVAFGGDLALGYRACLWLRTANRVLLVLATAPVAGRDDVYAAAAAVDWSLHLDAGGTLAVDFQGRCAGIDHPHFGAQLVKDAVVDQFRARTGTRPDVDAANPDLRINAHAAGGRLALHVDLSGHSLHRRGYRRHGGSAPLKENLAAAMLLLADWPARARDGAALCDPMCGSGTIAIEAALMARDVAPGLLRDGFGFSRWLGHDGAAFAAELATARGRAEAARARAAGTPPRIAAFDADAAMIALARDNAARAGVLDAVHFATCPLDAAAEAWRGSIGAGSRDLVVTNPPYGERLSTRTDAAQLYRELGALLARGFAGTHACILAPDGDVAAGIASRAKRSHAVHNGPIACHVHVLELAADAGPAIEPTAGADAGAFRNRLARNLAHIGRWARQNDIDCYRLYDRDMPEFAFAIDVYGGPEGRFVHVQEYAPPASVDAARSQARAAAALAALPEVLDVPPANVFAKVRRRMREREQYQKLAEDGAFHEVREHGRRLLVNFTDHLDTGLFLDHRPTRQLIAERARGCDFLNLFCYTGAATVAAACGGATTTTSVDVAAPYLDWARRNLALNGFGGAAHRLLLADCTEWLPRAARRPQRYGLIFLDPPTFSHGKRVRDHFEVQRDHVALIRAAVQLLAADGLLLFSTNFRRFHLDRAALADLAIDDITRQGIARDFARNPRIHQCCALRRRD